MFPENWPIVQVFDALSSQWRVGFAGATGLDYGAIEPVLRLKRIPESDWDEVFAGVQIMEAAALEQMRENAEES